MMLEWSIHRPLNCDDEAWKGQAANTVFAE
jgi:hypothetical protein